MRKRPWKHGIVFARLYPAAWFWTGAMSTLAGCANAKVGNIGARDGAVTDAADASGGKDAATADTSGGKPDDAGHVVYSPCDPFNNDGCSNPQKCAAFQSGSALALACGEKGGKSENDPCTQTLTAGVQTGDDCGEGLSCFNVGGKTICRRVCSPTGADTCPSGETCSMTVPGFVDPKFCAPTAAPTPCLPLEQSGCSSGQACYYTTTGAACYKAGTTQPGAACHAANDCSPGNTCLTINGNGACHAFCSTASGGKPDCSGSATGGTTCIAFGHATDEANLGSCQTP